MALSCFKNAICRKKLIPLPSLFYVFGHCDLNSGLIEMLRTIFEWTDYPIGTSIAIDVIVIRKI